ncbi:MAG: hypothetical protein RIC55_20290 [Pirellulaceae bacterium]
MLCVSRNKKLLPPIAPAMLRRSCLGFVLMAFAVALPGAPVVAQEAEEIEIESLTVRTDIFFNALTSMTKQDDQKSVFDNLLKTGPLSLPSRDGEVMELVDRYNKIVEKHGGYAGAVERISVKRFGGDLVLLKYLYKAENFPIIWYITYYRSHRLEGQPMEGWAVVSLRFDTRLELLDLTD